LFACSLCGFAASRFVLRSRFARTLVLGAARLAGFVLRSRFARTPPRLTRPDDQDAPASPVCSSDLSVPIAMPNVPALPARPRDSRDVMISTRPASPVCFSDLSVPIEICLRQSRAKWFQLRPLTLVLGAARLAGLFCVRASPAGPATLATGRSARTRPRRFVPPTSPCRSRSAYANVGRSGSGFAACAGLARLSLRV
jgi:hypothetical protein